MVHALLDTTKQIQQQQQQQSVATTAATAATTMSSTTNISSTIISSTIAILQNLPWSTLLPRATIGIIALLLGNAFIVGINQIYDKDIDIVNKPFLPVASGEMTTFVAWALVIASGIIGPTIV